MSLDIYLEPPPCQLCRHQIESYSSNITHNLNKMAMEAGIYGIVWRPEEHGITIAKQLIKPLRLAKSFKKISLRNLVTMEYGLYVMTPGVYLSSHPFFPYP